MYCLLSYCNRPRSSLRLNKLIVIEESCFFKHYNISVDKISVLLFRVIEIYLSSLSISDIYSYTRNVVLIHGIKRDSSWLNSETIWRSQDRGAETEYYISIHTISKTGINQMTMNVQHFCHPFCDHFLLRRCKCRHRTISRSIQIS